MPSHRAGTLLAALVVGACLPLVFAAPAAADLVSDVQAAAHVATDQGYRTGVAALDLRTGKYLSGGEDTAPFASESVAKVLIATQLLATGQMTGATAATAYEMITHSDDDAANALYGLAGGDDVINLVAARYQIPFLGTPPDESGWWGNTEITAKGMVYLYAAIARDPTVGPWLMNAMAHTTEYGADGTYQFFGIPSATTGAAIKQGWGDDGDDSPNAVFNSTGYVDNDEYAVAILTDGSPWTYGEAISSVVTQQAQALMPERPNRRSGRSQSRALGRDGYRHREHGPADRHRCRSGRAERGPIGPGKRGWPPGRDGGDDRSDPPIRRRLRRTERHAYLHGDGRQPRRRRCRLTCHRLGLGRR